MFARCVAACATTILLAGCESLYSVSASVGSGIASAASWAPTFLGPYRPDVHQGNIITQEMVDQLRIGMTRDPAEDFDHQPCLSPPGRPHGREPRSQ